MAPKKRSRKSVEEELRVEDKLKDIFYDIKSPASLSTWKKLRAEMIKQGYDVSKRDVVDFLTRQPVHGVFHKKKERFVRRMTLRKLPPFRIVVSDLLEMQSFAKFNSSMRFVALFQDQFSNHLTLLPIKTKGKQSMIECFDAFLASIPSEFKCEKLLCDRGSEYKCVESYLKSKYGIDMWHTKSQNKAFSVERFVRTAKSKLYRTMYFTNSLTWLKHLKDIQSSINNAKTLALFGHSANEIVTNAEIRKEVAKKFALKYVRHEQKYNTRPKYMVNDYVRFANVRDPFYKEYKSNFSDKIHKITKVIWSSPPTYQVDHKDTVFYEAQLVSASPSLDSQKKVLVIEKVRYRNDGRVTRSGKQTARSKEYLVKSVVDRNFKRWLNEAEVNRLKKDGRILHSNDL